MSDPQYAYPNGQPPNLRYVKCCASCKHVEMRYEGERACSKYVMRLKRLTPKDEAWPMSVDQDNICDSHESHTNEEQPR